MSAGGLSERNATARAAALEAHRARQVHGLARHPALLSWRVVKASARTWLDRAFGARTAAAVGDAYRRLRRWVQPS